MIASLRGLGDPALGSWEHPRPWDARKRDRDLICQILEHYEAQPSYGNLPRPNLPGADTAAGGKTAKREKQGAYAVGSRKHETTKTAALALAAADRTPPRRMPRRARATPKRPGAPVTMPRRRRRLIGHRARHEADRDPFCTCS